MKYFMQTAILRQIGHRRLAKLLAGFDEDLKACKFVLPEPNPEDEDYFADLSNAPLNLAAESESSAHLSHSSRASGQTNTQSR